VLVQHIEMGQQRSQTAVEAGGGDDRLGRHVSAVHELDAALVHTDDLGHHLDQTVPEALDDLGVDDGGPRPPPQRGHGTLGRLRQPVGRQVADHPAPQHPEHRVDEARRQSEQDRNGEIGGQPAEGAQQHVRRRAVGQRHPPGATSRDLVGDLHPGGTRAHDDDVLAAIRTGLAVLDGVPHGRRTLGDRTRPPRQHRLVEHPGGDDDVPGVHDAVGGAEPPPLRPVVETVYPHAGTHRDATALRVPAQVAHVLVAGRELAPRAGERCSRERGAPPVGVEPERVVPTCPRGGRRLPLLQHRGADTARAQLRGDREPARPAADHQHLIVHVAPLSRWPPRWP
jgi:hypothetical protein